MDELTTLVEDGPIDQALGVSPVLQRAKRNWNRVSEFESTFRMRFLEDLKFRHGDSDNGWQWPEGIKPIREVDNRPCLTMNIIRQHNLIISNEAKKNKSSPKFIGLGGGATQQSASIFNDLYRRIEYLSSAQSAYSIARAFQIDGGVGYWRVHYDYEDNDSMNQDIRILPIIDPLMIYMDLDAVQADRSDGKWAFVFDRILKSEFRKAHPNFKGQLTDGPLGINTVVDTRMDSSEYTTICEYFEKEGVEDLLISFVDQGQRRNIRKSLLPPNIVKKILDGPDVRTREIIDEKVTHYLIAGNQIVEQTPWAGKFIPLIQIRGEETRLEGRLDLKGHTRAMKDAQRMYNYSASQQVETVGLQGKTPWTGAADAIRELEQYWNSANRTNHAFLPFNHLDDQGNPLPVQALPRRLDPPVPSPAFEAGMTTAFNQMMMTSGQWQNQMGMMGNERTGAAIQKRQDQSSTATYHFQDSYEEGLIYTGKIVADLIPKVYDTKRIIPIVIPEENIDYELIIDPGAKQAFQQELNAQNEIIRQVLNPQIGKYSIASTVGPSLTSKDEETVAMIGNIIQQSPQTAGIIGDILVGSLPFEKAQEAAARLKRMVPPQALGQGPTQREQMMQQQIAMLTANLQKVLEEQAKGQLKLVGKDQMRDIDAYEAETKRMAALQKVLPLDQEGLRQVVQDLMQESLHTQLVPILEANAGNIEEGSESDLPPHPLATAGNNFVQEGATPPVPGARQSPHDGLWYMPDPTRQGQFLHVGPR